MPERYRTVVDVHVILRRHGRMLLTERANTGYADGRLCFPSGHLESDEDVVSAAIREAAEEVGIALVPDDLRCRHVMHHRNPEGTARIGFFFEAVRWGGEPVNREPHKCAGLHWIDPGSPPPNTVPYTAAAIAQLQAASTFSLDGWA